MKKFYGILLVLLFFAPFVLSAQQSSPQESIQAEAKRLRKEAILESEYLKGLIILKEKQEQELKEKQEKLEKQIEELQKDSTAQAESLESLEQELSTIKDLQKQSAEELTEMRQDLKDLLKYIGSLQTKLKRLRTENKILIVVGGVALLTAIVEGVILFTQD